MTRPAAARTKVAIGWQTKLLGLLLGLLCWAVIYAGSVMHRGGTEEDRILALGAVTLGFLLAALLFLLGSVGVILRKPALKMLPLYALPGFLVPFALTRIPVINLILNHVFAAILP